MTDRAAARARREFGGEDLPACIASSTVKRVLRRVDVKAPTPVSELANGEARVLQIDTEKLAVYRDEQGSPHAVSAVCTHLGCLVEWNGGERTWDCPCHGSRFRTDSTVIHGPAKRNLERQDLPSKPAPPGGQPS